jgi:hypothetical protein
MRMTERSDRLCLALKAPDELRILRELGLNDLDSDFAPDIGLLRTVDRRHAA